MRTGTFRHVEDILRDYPYTDRYVKEVKDNLRNLYCVDGDIREGKIDGQPINIASDNAIRHLIEHKYLVEWTLNESDDDTRQIINELYFKRNPTLTVTGVALTLNISRTVASRKRMHFFNVLVSRLGYRP